MPNIPQAELPKPKSWEEFEDICWDLYTRLWEDPHADRYGRSGEPQHGVDIFGHPNYLAGRCAGVQCKRYEEGRLTRAKIEAEIQKADDFSPTLAEYIIATTDPRTVDLQSFVLELRQEREKAGMFPVHIEFWDTLCGRLTSPNYRDILQKHYIAWIALAIECPPTIPTTLPDFASRKGGPFAFISYAREDADYAERLYTQLSAAGIRAWYDKEDLLCGEVFEDTIRKAIASCDFFIALLSEHYVSKTGFVQKEVRCALDMLDLRPPDQVFILPARLDDAQAAHPRLGALHRIDLFPHWNWNSGVSQIIRSIWAHSAVDMGSEKLRSQLDMLALQISALQTFVLKQDYDAFGADVPDERDELDELKQEYESLQEELSVKCGEDYDPLRRLLA